MLYIKDGTIRDGSRIVIRKNGMQIISPSEQMILADGWQPYVPEKPVRVPTVDEQLRDMILEQYNARTDISDKDALKRPLLVYGWDTYLGKRLAAGQVVSHEGTLYRVRQDIPVVIDTQAPSKDTAALYEVIEVEHEGTEDDPIPFIPPMELFAGKYYLQDDAMYHCTRDTGVAVSHDLQDMVGIYVELS